MSPFVFSLLAASGSGFSVFWSPITLQSSSSTILVGGVAALAGVGRVGADGGVRENVELRSSRAQYIGGGPRDDPILGCQQREVVKLSTSYKELTG